MPPKLIESDNPAQRFLGTFAERFAAETGSKYAPNFGRDVKAIKGMLAVHSEAKLLELLDKFWASKDSFILKAGRTVGVFASQLNKLVTMDATGNAASEPLLDSQGYEIQPGCFAVRDKQTGFVLQAMNDKYKGMVVCYDTTSQIFKSMGELGQKLTDFVVMECGR